MAKKKQNDEEPKRISDLALIGFLFITVATLFGLAWLVSEALTTPAAL